MPEHTLSPPTPIVARVVWAVDGEELVHTTALGRSGQAVYVRLADPRCRTNATGWTMPTCSAGSQGSPRSARRVGLPFVNSFLE